MPEFDFTISDESINDRGGRVLTRGINLKNFKKNPVGFYNHHRSADPYWGGDGDAAKILPVVRWENLKKNEDGTLTGTAVFDEDDDFSMSLYGKVSKGFINSVSIGIEMLAVSYDEKDLVKGQTRGTITKSNLREISIVDIPGNPNATKLAGGQQILMLSAAGKIQENLDEILPLIPQKKSGMSLFKGLSALFQTAETGTEEEVTQVAEQLKADVEKTEGEIETLKGDLADKESEITALTAERDELTGEIETLKADLKVAQEKNTEFETRLAGLEEKYNAQVEHTEKIVEQNNLKPGEVDQLAGGQVEQTSQDQKEKEIALANMSPQERAEAAYYEALELRNKQKQTDAEAA